MKKTILLIFISFTGICFGQIPTNGLIGYWPFNGNVNDSSGNGNNGNVFGAVLTTDRFGNLNSAYHFDGTDDLIQFAIQNLPVGSQSRSIFCWAKQDSSSNTFSQQNTLFHYGNVVTDQRSCILLWPGTPVYIGQTNDVCNGCSGSVNVSNPPDAADHLWHQFGITYSGDTLRLYSDGQLVAYRIYSYQTQSTGFFKVGFSDSTHYNGEPFLGSIDDVMLYDRALTSAEIQQMYNPSFACQGSILPMSLLQGLAAWYPFCGNSIDESGNGNNGLVNGCTLTNNRFGDANSAYDFNGITDHITVNSSSSLEIDGTLSISVWIKTTTSLDRTILDKGQATNYWNYGLNIDDGRIGYSYTNFTVGPNQLINDGNWHHIVATINENANSMSFYVDGLKTTSFTNFSSGLPYSGPFTSFINPTIGASLFIGNNGSTGAEFPGEIDDIGIWNRELDSNEVALLYQSELNTINQLSSKNNIHIYPNPASDYSTIDIGDNFSFLKDGTIQILNSIGQLFYTKKIESEITSVDLTALKASGVYFVFMKDRNGNAYSIKKLIVY